MSVAEHHAYALKRVACFVLTVSDSRTLATETSGRAIAELSTTRTQVTGRSRAQRAHRIDRVVRQKSPPAARASSSPPAALASPRFDMRRSAALFDKRLDGFVTLPDDEASPDQSAAMLSRYGRV
jgi:molybdopterin biosynthesis enzyme MoaB